MDPSILLSDEAFARRIAIALLRDRAAAEDLVQDAWLSLLERPPKHDANPRGYLALILARLAARRRRGEARRSSRERQRAPGEPPPSTAEVIARAEIHQLTVAAVLKLEDPYRSTVLLHFFEDMGFDEIAARERIPVETVRTRHKRALAMLRARLEDEGRDWREEWAVALAGSRWPEPGVAGATRRTALRLGLVGLVCVAPLLVWLLRDSPAHRESGPRVAARDAEPAGGSPADLAAAPTSAPERAAVVTEADPTPAGPWFTGRVTDEGGNPLSGVRVELAPDTFGPSSPLGVTTTDGAGRFALPLERWAALSPAGRGLLGLVVGYWKPGYMPGEERLELGPDGMPSEYTVALQTGRVLSLRAVDSDGNGLDAMRALLQVSANDPAEPARRTGGLSDPEGWVAFGLEPGERPVELLLWTAKHGYAFRDESDLPARTEGDIELGPVLVRSGLELSGRCSYPDGSPARYLHLSTRRMEPAPDGSLRPLDEGPRSELATGLVRVLSYTDGFGRFRFRGLRPGSYQLVVSDALTPYPLEERAWAAGETSIEALFPNHRVVVEVLDPEHEVLEEARVAIAYWTSEGELSREPTLTLTVGRQFGLHARAGETISLLAVAPGCGVVEERFDVPTSRYETEVTLELPLEDRRATLALKPRTGRADAWLVDLCAPLSGLPIPGLQDFVPDADGRVSGLPAGEYLVRLEPRLAPEDERPSCAELGLPVALVPGETALPFAVLPAARLRLNFEGAAESPSAHFPPATARGNISLDQLEGVGTGRWDWIGVSIKRSRGHLEVRSLAPDAGNWVRRFWRIDPRPGQTLEVIAPAGPLRVRLVLDGRLQEYEPSTSAGETLEISVSLGDPAPAR